MGPRILLPVAVLLWAAAGCAEAPEVFSPACHAVRHLDLASAEAVARQDWARAVCIGERKVALLRTLRERCPVHPGAVAHKR